MLQRAPFRSRHLVPADPVLRAVVEVLVRGQPARRAESMKCLRERVARAPLGHRQRAAGPVELALAALVVLGALEVGEHLVPRPAGPPAVVVERVAADVDERVDRGRAAQHPPAREVDAAVVRVRLVDRRVVPVLRAPVQRREGGGEVDQLVRVRAAGLDQEDRDVRVLAEPVGKHAAGRAGPDDHVVVHEPTLTAGSSLASAARIRAAILPARHGRPQAETVPLADEQAPLAAQDRDAGPPALPALRPRAPSAPRLPQLRHLRRPRGRRAAARGRLRRRVIAVDANGADQGPAAVAEGVARSGLPVLLFGPES